MEMSGHALSHWQIFDDAMVLVGREFEDVLALIEFDPRIPSNNIRMFFENEEIVLLGDEIVWVVVLDNPPILPLLDRWSRAHRTNIRTL